MPDDKPSEWTAGLAPEDAAFVAEQKWAGPGDVLKAYRERVAATDPWGDLEPEVRQATVDAKKWAKPSDAARAYAGVQKLLGKPPDELVHLPAAGITAEQKRALLERVLGTPKDPDGYDFGELKDPEGGTQVLKWFRGLAHEIGLGPAEAKLAAEKWVAFGQEAQAAEETARTARLAEAAAKIKAELGGTFEAAEQDHLRALDALGIRKGGEVSDVEAMLAEAMGPEAFFKTFASIGKQLQGYKVVEGTSGDGIDSVRAAIDAIKADPNSGYWKREHPGHEAAVARVNALYEKLHGTAAAWGPGAQGE